MKIILRVDAKAAALKQYFTGIPCISGHLAPKLTINGACCECSRIRQLKSYEANNEQHLRKQKERRDSDPLSAEKKRARKIKHDPGLPERIASRASESLAQMIAKNNGQSKYASAKKCAHDHVGMRFTSDRKCVECNRIACIKKYERISGGIPRNLVFRQTMDERRETALQRKSDHAESVAWWHSASAARQEAILKEEKTYLGRACPSGHDGTRYSGSGKCVNCAASYAASIEKKNYDAIYYRKNEKRIRLRTQIYAKQNSARNLIVAQKWLKENPERNRAIKMSYKARRRSSEGIGDSTAQIHSWEKSQKKVCYWCSVDCAENYHIDHYQPLSKGGQHIVTNLVIACPTCNLTKSAKDPYKFANTKGMLF